MKTLLDLGISTGDREQLLSGLHEGKYNLLLGAGASYGCEGGDGVELRDGATLSQQIAKAFSLKLNDEEQKKLPLTYEEADSKDKVGFRRWLQERFIGCKPTWQMSIFEIHWERVWTFNIDDVLGNAFDVDKENNVCAKFEDFDWKERVKPLEDTPDTQQVVYLHGRAKDLGGPLDGLVFSIPEYAGATQSFQQWHASFQTHYLEDPFIVCGASLAEEVDISEAIRTKNFSRAGGFPSFIVSRDLDEGQMDRMRRFNLVPIVCPLEEFFLIVIRELGEYRKTADAVVSRLKKGTYERFLAQFRRLDTKDTSRSAIEGTDFYGGDEPTWKDVLTDLDAVFISTDNAARILDRRVDRYAVLVHGASVSGKSSALLRIARQAIRKGFKPFWFRHEEGFSAEAAADYLSQDEKAILFIDDAESHVEAVGKMLKLARNLKKSARVFISLRSQRIRGFRIDVADEFRHEFRLGPLRQKDVVSLVRKRRRASRLGKHITQSDSVIINELLFRCRSELLECISYIEFSEPLRERVRKLVVAALSIPNQREFIARVVCVHRFGFSLPLRAALMSSGRFVLLSNFLDRNFKADGILVHDHRGIRFRHRILSEYAWADSFTVDERYKAMSAVVGALAPLVNPAVIRVKGIEHLILREVLDQANVSLSLGERALDFYEVHEPSLGWSSRYWDQRALLESKVNGNFSRAYSFSQKAISLEKHPFAYTSLGAICMTQSARIIENNRMEAMKLFYEGESALSTAWKLADEAGKLHEHPFVKFFASAANLLRKIAPNDTEFESILQLYRVWVQRAEDSAVFATSFGQKRLRDVRATELKQSLRARRAEG